MENKKKYYYAWQDTPEYRAWHSIKQRCTNKNVDNYERYGGKGITVCQRWQKFENFLEDMGKRPSPKHSIGRINSNGNYTPKNCRWETMEEQSNNRSNNRLVTINGETKTVAEWARLSGLKYRTILARVNACKGNTEKVLNKELRSFWDY